VNDPRKNFPLLVEALRLARQGGARAELTVVGPQGGGWPERLAREGLGRAVGFAGKVTLAELAAAYRASDLLVVSSRQEGFGIVVAEALHAALPVACTRCGGPEAIVRRSGAGVLVEQTAAALAAAIRALDSDRPRLAAMRARASRFAADALSFDRFAEQVAALTAELRARTRGRAAAR
jgi:glycosyltransferase involved in cell wall biosynthesis